MGLLSRFGRGLTQAAPIMGQMAQASMLQAADEKKYNRLVEREELKHTRGLESAELAYTRGSAAAERKERITFLDTGINLISDQINTEIEGLAQLREDKAAAQLTPINRQIVDAMIKQGEDRLAKAIETRNRISSMYQSYVDPEGKLGVFSEPEEKSILTDAALIQAANLAINEIVGFEGREGPGIGGDTLTTFEVASNIDKAPEIIEQQLKDIDDSLVGKAEPLNEKQKQLFRDTVNTYVQARQSRGGLPSPDMSRSGEEAAQIKTLPEEAEEGNFFQETPSVTISPGGAGAEAAMYSRWGEKVLTTAGKLTKQLYDKLSSVNIEEELKDSIAQSEMKSKLLEAINTQSTDATIAEILGTSEEAALSSLKGVGGVPTRTSTVLGAMIWLLNSGWDIGEVVEAIKAKGNKVSSKTPSAEDAIAMMFTMPQRV